MNLLGLVIFFIGLSSCSTKTAQPPAKAISIIYFSENEEKVYNEFRVNKLSNFPDKSLQLNYEAISEGFDNTLLHGAINVTDNSVFDYILANTKLIDRPNSFDKTPLSLAVENNDLYKAKKLLERGANVNHKEFLGSPIFFLALKNENLSMLNLLMSYKFNPNVSGFMDKRYLDFKFANQILRNYAHQYQPLIKKKFSN